MLLCSYYKIKNRQFKLQNRPPSKKPPSTKSFTPTSSRPTPTRRTPMASSCGLILLRCRAPARQYCHPNRRRNMMTHVWVRQTDSNVTACKYSYKQYQLDFTAKVTQTINTLNTHSIIYIYMYILEYCLMKQWYLCVCTWAMAYKKWQVLQCDWYLR